MQTELSFKKGQISAKAVINKVKINSLPSSFFDYSNNPIIPYGVDNIYPNRIHEAISKSPTASGCIKRMREFIYGNGVVGVGETVVNRDGETLNDIVKAAIDSYVKYRGFALHYNFNVFGQIVEITNIDLRFIRKTKWLEKVKVANFEQDYTFFSGEEIYIDLYSEEEFKELSYSKFQEYKGQIYYFSDDGNIYPTATIDSASISASYECEAQIYPYANIKNGFSGNTIIKYASILQGEEGQEETNKIKDELESLHGADRAGSSLVVQVPVNVSGDANNFNMVEHLSPTNVDSLFLNQNSKAEGDILKVFTMPKILLGVSDNGMFNSASFNDAFNYKNADTEGDRKKIEREFNSILSNSIFASTIELEPLKMKGDDGVVVSDDENNTGISKEQLAAQAGLKGSVGRVQGILSIQEKFAQKLTTEQSALSILKLIYGFSEKEARQVLGSPQKENTNV